MLNTCLLLGNEVMIKKNCTSAFDKGCDLIELHVSLLALTLRRYSETLKMNKHANTVAFSLFTDSSLTFNYMLINTQQHSIYGLGVCFFVPDGGC